MNGTFECLSCLHTQNSKSLLNGSQACMKTLGVEHRLLRVPKINSKTLDKKVNMYDQKCTDQNFRKIKMQSIFSKKNIFKRN